jgi:putative signal transducing protein
MKAIFHSHSSLEASMIVDLLAQRGLHGHIFGEALQGGMGELPATGLVRVMVNNDDAASAEEVIQQWQQQQPADPTIIDTATIRPLSEQHDSAYAFAPHNSNRQRSNVIGAFIMGILVGVLITTLI